MLNQLLVPFIAVLGGISITVQGQMMAVMDRALGTFESVFITYVTGAVVLGLMLLLFRDNNLGQWQQLPWWALTSGLFGLVIVSAISFSIPRLGLVSAFTLIVASQFIVAALIDHFGLMGSTVNPITPSKLAGIGTLMLGVWLTLR